MRIPTQDLRDRGIEVLERPGRHITLPDHTVIEAPASLKWTTFENLLELGAFSYQVSGYAAAAKIGRYCSFGEDVQIGRQSHPTTWASTSPAFYLGGALFDISEGFQGAADFQALRFTPSVPPTQMEVTTIGHDVYIGHGAYIRAGVTIGTGAIIAGGSVVTSDIPPYAVVAGNPAVIKKMRVPPDMIACLLMVEWWRFAPWQLAHLDPSDIQNFIDGVADMHDVPPFKPDVIDLRQRHESALAPSV